MINPLGQPIKWVSFGLAAFAMVAGAFKTLVPMIEPAAQIAPTFELLRPIIEAEPEIAEDKQVIEKLSGGIQVILRWGNWRTA